VILILGGIVLIFLGFSGGWVLRGGDSTDLAYYGVFLAVFGTSRLIYLNRKREREERAAQEWAKKMLDEVDEDESGSEA
jgi:hypothetical protein